MTQLVESRARKDARAALEAPHGEAPVTGTVKGNKIEFSFKASGPVEGTVTYTGTIDGNTMKGTAKFGDLGEATWTAKKQ